MKKDTFSPSQHKRIIVIRRTFDRLLSCLLTELDGLYSDVGLFRFFKGMRDFVKQLCPYSLIHSETKALW